MTAVQWLEMEIVKLETKYAILGEIYELCEQAKEMEKQQIIDAYKAELYPCSDEDAEQYYNETFNDED
jgi:hypothetical protein